MRIAWITSGFSKDENDYGGAAAIHNLAREISKQQSVELVIFSFYYPCNMNEYKFYNAKVYSFRKATGHNAGPLEKLNIWRRCKKKFASEHMKKKFDIIHSFWAGEPGFIASGLSRKFNIPLIANICGGELAELKGIKYGSRLKIFQKQYVNRTFKSAAVIISGSDYISEKVKLCYNRDIYRKVRKIPFGADDELFLPAEKKFKRRLISIANAVPVKSHADLFKALKIVIEKYPETVLECYGRDDNCILEKLAVQEGVSGSVKIKGFVDYEKIPGALNKGGIFVLGSLYESQNMALIEAAFCGLPVVSTDAGIAREVTPHIVKPGDYRALAEAVLSVMENPVADYKDLRNILSLKNSARNFIELYLSLTS